MNPLAIKPMSLLVGAAVALVIGFSAGWTSNGWRLGAELSDVKRVNAETISQASQVAMSDYQDAAKTIKDAASSAQLDLSNVSAQLATIRRNQKNAPPEKLPIDCRPGPIRLHNLSETAAAADASIARPVSSK